jgi:hypothetical protein
MYVCEVDRNGENPRPTRSKTPTNSWPVVPEKPLHLVLYMMCMRVSICFSTCIYVHIHVNAVCMYVCIYVCMYVRMHACMYVCMCVCTHKHTQHTNTHTFKKSGIHENQKPLPAQQEHTSREAINDNSPPVRDLDVCIAYASLQNPHERLTRPWHRDWNVLDPNNSVRAQPSCTHRRLGRRLFRLCAFRNCGIRFDDCLLGRFHGFQADICIYIQGSAGDKARKRPPDEQRTLCTTLYFTMESLGPARSQSSLKRFGRETGKSGKNMAFLVKFETSNVGSGNIISITSGPSIGLVSQGISFLLAGSPP